MATSKANDPLGLEAGPNIYSYVGGDPLSRRDPAGLLPSSFNGDLGNISKNLVKRKPNIPPDIGMPKEPYNGNPWGRFEDQDWQTKPNTPCTVPSWLQSLNANDCAKQCCVKHDKCYERYGCNYRSWMGVVTPLQFVCQQCNVAAVACIGQAYLAGPARRAAAAASGAILSGLGIGVP
jgi:hypothetical protein